MQNDLYQKWLEEGNEENNASYLREALRQLLDFGQCFCGFVAEVCTKENLITTENPQGFYLQIRAAYDMKKKLSFARSVPDIQEGIETVKFIEPGAFYLHAINFGDIIMANQLAEDFRRAGSVYPVATNGEGVDNVAVIPLRFHGKGLGILVLGARAGGFSRNIIATFRPHLTNITVILQGMLYDIQCSEQKKRDSFLYDRHNLTSELAQKMRTPLNSLISSVGILEATPLTNTQNECVGLMRKSSYGLLRSVNELFDLAALDTAVELQPGPAVLPELIQESYNIASVAFDANTLKFVCEYEEELPKSFYFDRARLKNVLIHLLNNACRFAPGTIRVHVENAPIEDIHKYHLLNADKLPPIATVFDLFSSSSNNNNNNAAAKTSVEPYITRGWSSVSLQKMHKYKRRNYDLQQVGKWQYVKISIIDGGPGLTTEKRDVFRDFPGVGLKISRYICESMRGILDFVSTPQGSAFYIILPLPEYIPEKDIFVDPERLAGKRALLIEPDEEIAEQVTAYLGKWKIDYVECISAKRAAKYIENCSKGTFDIVLAAAETPDLQEISLPVLILARNIENEHPVYTYILVRPLKENDFLKAIAAVLTAGRKRAESRAAPTAVAVPPTVATLNILILDDQHFEQQVLLKLLKNMGITNVDVSKDYKSLIDRLQYNRGLHMPYEKKKFAAASVYHVIIVDLVKTDNLKAIRKMREQFKDPRLSPKLLGLVTVDELATNKYMVDYGLDGLVSKPLESHSKLFEAIKNIISR